MKKLFLLFALCFLVVRYSSAQEYKGLIWGASLGYQHLEVNFAKASIWTLFAPNADQYMKVHAGVDYTGASDRPHFIPEVSFTYYLTDVAAMPFLKAEVTPYTVTPKVGVGIFSLVDIDAGYGFELSTPTDKKSIKGFSFGLGVNIPFNLYFKR